MDFPTVPQPVLTATLQCLGGYKTFLCTTQSPRCPAGQDHVSHWTKTWQPCREMLRHRLKCFLKFLPEFPVLRLTSIPCTLECMPRSAHSFLTHRLQVPYLKCVYACMSVYICMCVHMHVNVYIQCMHICVHVCYLCMSVCMYMCLCGYVCYVSMYV